MEIPKLKYSTDCWEYETKCRRCGAFSMWHFSEKKRYEHTIFAEYMQSCLQYPRTYHCEECKTTTVQDITAYNLNG